MRNRELFCVDEINLNIILAVFVLSKKSKQKVNHVKAIRVCNDILNITTPYNAYNFCLKGKL